jgi:TPR repeat protein
MTEAVNYYQQAAAQGSVEAMIQLYLCLWEGRGVNADHTQAMQWLTKAADAGNAYAQCLMGYRCENTEWEGEGANHYLPQPNWREAFRWHRLSANQNWAGGEYCLGLLYLDGHGVEKNEERSLEMIRAAADQGHTQAITKLAELYAEGIGEPRNQQDQPTQLLKRARAWSELIFRYEYALGTERDLVSAARYSYQVALSNTWQTVTLEDRVEFKPSQQLQGVQLITPSDEHVQIFGPPKTDDVPRVLSLYLKAATGNGAAAAQIGQMYLNGQDTPRNPTQACIWFSIATRAGNVESRQQVSVAESRMSGQEIKDAPLQLAALVQELSRVASAIEAQ